MKNPLDMSELIAALASKERCSLEEARSHLLEYLHRVEMAHTELFANLAAALQPGSKPAVRDTLVDQAIRVHGAMCSIISLARFVETRQRQESEQRQPPDYGDRFPPPFQD